MNGPFDPKATAKDAASSAFTPKAPDDAVLQRLALLPPLDYDRVRVPESEQMGVRVSTLDVEVERARAALIKQPDAQDSSAIPPPVPESWPEPVHTLDLLDDLVAAIGRHIVLSAAACDAIALWILHTWIY